MDSARGNSDQEDGFRVVSDNSSSDEERSTSSSNSIPEFNYFANEPNPLAELYNEDSDSDSEPEFDYFANQPNFSPSTPPFQVEQLPVMMNPNALIPSADPIPEFNFANQPNQLAELNEDSDSEPEFDYFANQPNFSPSTPPFQVEQLPVMMNPNALIPSTDPIPEFNFANQPNQLAELNEDSDSEPEFNYFENSESRMAQQARFSQGRNRNYCMSSPACLLVIYSS